MAAVQPMAPKKGWKMSARSPTVSLEGSCDAMEEGDMQEEVNDCWSKCGRGQATATYTELPGSSNTATLSLAFSRIFGVVKRYMLRPHQLLHQCFLFSQHDIAPSSSHRVLPNGKGIDTYRVNGAKTEDESSALISQDSVFDAMAIRPSPRHPIHQAALFTGQRTRDL
jgi:hypothetical protein